MLGRMPVYDIYSRRKRRAEQGEPDVYQYERVPRELRLQVRLLLNSLIAEQDDWWRRQHSQLLREMAWPELYGSPSFFTAREDILAAIEHNEAVDHWLDVVEFCFASIYDMSILLPGEYEFKDAIEELNIRFRQAGFGYQFEGGQIVRVDSQLLHSEVVKPTLVLLSDPRFAGAQDEFLTAHAHYLAGEYEDAIVDANRAFESTMKAICESRGWEYAKGARASDLIKIIRRNRLLPDYLDNSFDQLIAILQSGLPQIRNEAGGHGQGSAPRQTPSYVAGYALHLAAAKIVLLVEALKATET
jgi:hypothetical protein